MQPKHRSPSGSTIEEPEEEYVVEKIVDHRTNKKGRLEYFLKWKGFSDAENTWEPASNLNCKNLVEEYELQRTKSEKATPEVKSKSDKDKDKATKVTKETKRKATEDSITSKRKKAENGEIKVSVDNGFEKGWTAEEILGATETYGELYFLIKWKENKDATLLSAKITNVKIPQMVIAFYEARTTWDNKNKDGKEKESASVNDDAE